MKAEARIILAAAMLAFSAAESKPAGTVLGLSTTGQTNVAGAGESLSASLSRDGRTVAFVSFARNLVTNDDHAPFLNVFARDVVAGTTALVSVNATGLGGGNADANSPSISSNGQFIAFASAADNLVNNDTNDAPDIFVRDLAGGVTRLVSVERSGAASAGVVSPWTRHRLSGNPQISADGRWVIFESLATNLVVQADANQLTDIFARDMLSNVTFLVSVNAAGTATGNGNSESPSITPDARFVAFVSTSTDLAGGATNQLGDIYVRDLQSGTTAWASANVGGLFNQNYRCFGPVISADGRFVAFKASNPQDPSTILVFRHDVQLSVSTILTTNSTARSLPQISDDGRFVSSESLNDVYQWDLQTGSNVLVSVNSAGNGGGNQPSRTPVMTPDGRSVVFLSAATNISDNAANGVSQVYCRDLVSGITRLVSVTTAGNASGRETEMTLPAVSADGRRVAFESLAGDLVPNDFNQASDVFLRDLDLGTTDIISRRHDSLPQSAGLAVAALSPQMIATIAGVPITTNPLPPLSPRFISADGQTIAFFSYDSNLSSDDTNQFPDIFVRGISTGNVLRVNQGRENTGSGYRLGNEAALSADGRYLACGTAVGILFTGFGESVFRYNLANGSNEQVSVRYDGAPASASSVAPVISSDGNLVAFCSAADDLVNGISTSVSNIYVRDMTLRTNYLVSLNYLGNQAGNGISFSPSFSPDDRWILFGSAASNLTTNNTGGMTNLFARDLLSNVTRIVSIGPDGGSPIGFSRGAMVSADSRHVAYLTGSGAAVYNFASRTSAVVCTTCDNPTISADGRLVAHEIGGTDGSPKQIVVKDIQTGQTNLISINRDGTGGGNGHSTSPLLSWDGRFVVFASKASDLVENDTNNASDIFVRDRALGTTLLVSLNLPGTGPGNGPSSKPALAADGRTVVFQSMAGDLVAGDFNGRRDVFVLHLGGADTDHDGMDDDWEMAYFGTLARDGTGDFDNDGRTDLQEFLAGTDPTSDGSVLRVLTLSSLGAGGTRVIWSASPGKSYRVQFKDNVDDSGWNYLPGTIIAPGTTAGTVDNSSTGVSHRFYRAVLAP